MFFGCPCVSRLDTYLSRKTADTSPTTPLLPTVRRSRPRVATPCTRGPLNIDRAHPSSRRILRASVLPAPSSLSEQRSLQTSAVKGANLPIHFAVDTVIQHHRSSQQEHHVAANIMRHVDDQHSLRNFLTNPGMPAESDVALRLAVKHLEREWRFLHNRRTESLQHLVLGVAAVGHRSLKAWRQSPAETSS